MIGSGHVRAIAREDVARMLELLVVRGAICEWDIML
jgi:hypothetical protein